MISVNGIDCTHFTEKGANKMAKLVSRGHERISKSSKICEIKKGNN